jgi:hypothetical protein
LKDWRPSRGASPRRRREDPALAKPVTQGKGPGNFFGPMQDAVQPDELSPKAALEALYRLKGLLQD